MKPIACTHYELKYFEENKVQVMNNGVYDLQCPIEQDIPKVPVIASDGYVYEKAAIENQMRMDRESGVVTKSAYLRTRITDKLIESNSYNQLRNHYLGLLSEINSEREDIAHLIRYHKDSSIEYSRLWELAKDRVIVLEEQKLDLERRLENLEKEERCTIPQHTEIMQPYIDAKKAEEDKRLQLEKQLENEKKQAKREKLDAFKISHPHFQLIGSIAISRYVTNEYGIHIKNRSEEYGRQNAATRKADGLDNVPMLACWALCSVWTLGMHAVVMGYMSKTATLYRKKLAYKDRIKTLSTTDHENQNDPVIQRANFIRKNFRFPLSYEVIGPHYLNDTDISFLNDALNDGNSAQVFYQKTCAALVIDRLSLLFSADYVNSLLADHFDGPIYEKGTERFYDRFLAEVSVSSETTAAIKCMSAGYLFQDLESLKSSRGVTKIYSVTHCNCGDGDGRHGWEY